MVSGLMIIERPGLLKAARIAQRCFFRQTWPLKQLVVFNATGRRLNFFPKRRVLEIRLRRLPRAQMLHILRENADGEWCVLWDCDCWYDRSVIDRHMRVAERETAVIFRNITAFSLVDQKGYVISDDRIIHGSFLRASKIDFENPFYRQLARLKIVDNPADLVVKFVNRIRYEA